MEYSNKRFRGFKMKEKDFYKQKPNMEIEVKIYYSLDEETNIILDVESMTNEFNNKIDKLLNIIDGVKE